jgi:hypothetical protein
MYRSANRAGFIICAAALLAGGSVAAVGQTAAAAPFTASARGTSAAQAEVAAASAAGTSGQLHAVTAVSAKNAWAVGCSGSCNGPHSLILHWNGVAWSKVASPDPGPGADELTGVTAVSASDAWAVGYACNTSDCGEIVSTLILHWNGTKWASVPSPDPSTVLNQLFGVTAVSADDVWAAGSDVPDAATLLSSTLVLHWNGTKWSRVPSPTVSDASTTLYGVNADSARDAWAVGNECIYPACPDPGITTDAVTLHWNGTKWSIVASPSPGETNNVLFGVSAVTPDNAWAVGVTNGDALIDHWNGTKWSQVKAANPGSSFNDLQAVSAASAGDVWAAGLQLGAALPYTTLTERWTGTAWSAVPSPNGTTSTSGLNVNFLSGVVAISATRAIAVGWAQIGTTYRVLILQWNGKAWLKA